MANSSILKKQVKRFVENTSEQELKLINHLFEINRQEDWWNEIDKDHQRQIKNAIKEADTGKGIPHAEMANRYKKWLEK